MTPQETYDIATRALRRQGGPSMLVFDGVRASCRYRGENGRRCAAGHLLPDDKYRPSFEGQIVACRGQVADILAAEGHDVPLADALQNAHDAAATQEGKVVSDDVWLVEWTRRMKIIADEFKLSSAALYEPLTPDTNTPT